MMVGYEERGWGFIEGLCVDIYICGVDLACLEIRRNSFLFQCLRIEKWKEESHNCFHFITLAFLAS